MDQFQPGTLKINPSGGSQPPTFQMLQCPVTPDAALPTTNFQRILIQSIPTAGNVISFQLSQYNPASLIATVGVERTTGTGNWSGTVNVRVVLVYDGGYGPGTSLPPTQGGASTKRAPKGKAAPKAPSAKKAAPKGAGKKKAAPKSKP